MIDQLPEPVTVVFAVIGFITIVGIVAAALAWLVVETVEALNRRWARRPAPSTPDSEKGPNP